MKKLQGRTAVITGASSGIGRALALQLAKKGCQLALVDVDKEGLEESERLVKELVSDALTSLHVMSVADEAAMMALPDAVIEAHDDVHLLINNAGVAHIGNFAESDVADFRWVLEVNLMGVLYGVKAFLPHLLARESGHIVNMSSLFGVVGVPKQSAYCTSKFAVRGFSAVLWEELQGTSVDVTCVHPGGVNTGIVKNARAEDVEEKKQVAAAFAKYAQSPDKVAAKIVKAIEKNKARLLVAPASSTIDRLMRVFPVWGNRIVGRILGVKLPF
ncbi:MAG: SDR family NAD(P)-dependent oxidoreductase [Deltaproteobacteria bacterium]|nr:SDR family NAD(P)-dependent oxidoreductase [Deltaproteobacteria bacterium]